MDGFTPIEQLSFWSLGLGDADFVHQHVVDAYGAQIATADSKPIAVVFTLGGLFLHLEEGASGREVQRAHMRMARTRRTWPTFDLPIERGDVTVSDALAATPGPERIAAIDDWCRSVWEAYADLQEPIRNLVDAADPDRRRI